MSKTAILSRLTWRGY